MTRLVINKFQIETQPCPLEFIHENAFEYAICEITAIFPGGDELSLFHGSHTSVSDWLAQNSAVCSQIENM